MKSIRFRITPITLPIILMFIGGGSGSCAGGLKVETFQSYRQKELFQWPEESLLIG